MPTNNIGEPITVTVQEAQKLSGLGPSKLYDLISEGALEAITIGKRRLIGYESLRRLLTSGSPIRRKPGRPRKTNGTFAPKVEEAAV